MKTISANLPTKHSKEKIFLSGIPKMEKDVRVFETWIQAGDEKSAIGFFEVKRLCCKNFLPPPNRLQPFVPVHWGLKSARKRVSELNIKQCRIFIQKQMTKTVVFFYKNLTKVKGEKIKNILSFMELKFIQESSNKLTDLFL